jgi:hypothetical protein
MTENVTPQDNPAKEVDFDKLSKAGASRLIDELQEVSGRGASNGNGTS